jgi:hypothetical protein
MVLSRGSGEVIVSCRKRQLQPVTAGTMRYNQGTKNIYFKKKKKEKGKSEMRRKIAHKSKSSPAVI